MQRIVIMRGGVLGDFVVTLPAIESLRTSFPNCDLTLVGDPKTLQLASASRIIDQNLPQFVSLHAPGTPHTHQVRAIFEGVDLVVAYTPNAEPGIVSVLEELGVKNTIAWDPRPQPGKATSTHIVDHLLLPLETMGLPILSRTSRIRDGFAKQAYFESRRPDAWTDRPITVLHPGSGGRRKCWPVENYAALAESICENSQACVVLFGPVENELTPDIKDRFPDRCLILRPPGLPELAGVLSFASLYVGNDSGPTHLAAAMNVPTLALFGPTDPKTLVSQGTSRFCFTCGQRQND